MPSFFCTADNLLAFIWFWDRGFFKPVNSFIYKVSLAFIGFGFGLALVLRDKLNK